MYSFLICVSYPCSSCTCGQRASVFLRERASCSCWSYNFPRMVLCLSSLCQRKGQTPVTYFTVSPSYRGSCNCLMFIKKNKKVGGSESFIRASWSGSESSAQKLDRLSFVLNELTVITWLIVHQWRNATFMLQFLLFWNCFESKSKSEAAKRFIFPLFLLRWCLSSSWFVSSFSFRAKCR